MKLKSLLKNFWLPLLLCVSQLAASQTFTFNNWYGLANAKVTDADDCGTVKKVVATFNGWPPCQFQILLDGKALGTSDLVSKIANVYYEGSGDEPAWRVTTSSSSDSWTYTFYINMRVTPYQILDAVPSGDFNTAMISSSTSLLTTSEESFTLTGKACSSVEDATFEYQWMKSTDGGNTWKKVSGATEESLQQTSNKDTIFYELITNVIYDEIQDNGDGTYDTLKNASHSVTSNVISVCYKQPSISLSATVGSNAQKFNAQEFEVTEGGTVNFKAVTSDFEDGASFTLQYRSLEGTTGENSWIDLSKQSELTWSDVAPTVSAEYRVKVVGKSKYSGLKTTIYSSDLIVVRKIYVVDTEKFEYDVLWNEDFGTFSSAKVYIDSEGETHSGSVTVDGTSLTVENYWAPDPLNCVKEHKYAALDPNFKNNTRDWCSKYRLEDGYYIITSNPYKGDGKNNYSDRDYWEGEDHTSGDTNGGMLFVNCAAGLEGVLIYERKLSLNCSLSTSKGVWVIFSAFLNNAVYKEGSETPVNVRLEVLDESDNVVYTVSSGDINQRKGMSSLTPDTWANMSFRFLATEQNYTFRLYNNAPGGANWGNDILMDDISVTLCYPKVELIAKSEENRTNYVAACKDETIRLVAFNEEGLDKYIGTPKYLFQYSSDKKIWKDYGSIQEDSILTISATEDIVGTNYFRVIVASDESVIRSLADGESVERSCATIYAMDDGMTVKIGQPFELQLTATPLSVCIGDSVVEAVATPVQAGIAPTTYYWYFDNELIDSTFIDTFRFDISAIDKAGTYTIEARAIDDVCQKDITSKVWDDSNKDTLKVDERNKLTLEVSKTEFSWGESIDFTIDNGGYTGDTLVWHENGGRDSLFISENISSLTIPTGQNGEVRYHIEAPAEYGCVDPSDTITVNVSLEIPNLITPHNNESYDRNDDFLVGKNFHTEIYNRYQQLIYEGEDGWDATYKGDIAEPGTYYYRIHMPNGEWKKGTLEVAKFK